MKQKTIIQTIFLLFALIVGSTGSAWSAVVSGTTYNTTSTSSLPDGWSGNGSGTSYIQLTSSSNYIQTSTFVQNGFTSIKIKARTYGGPSDAQALITVSWYDETTETETVLGTIAPSNSTLKDYTISSPNNPTGNTSGYIKIQCKGASSSKGSGVSQVTVTYTTGTLKTLSSIAVTTAPSTTAYKIGEAFSTTGMVVTATYSDASTAPVTGYTMSIGEDALANGDILTSAGDKTVTITYQEKTCNQAITVAGVTSLAVKTAPTKTAYKYGETLDLTGLELTATFSDSGTKDLTEGFTASPANGSELTASGNVALTYYGQSCNQAITVGTLSSLTYNSTGEGAFANTTYTEKDKFDPTGLVVTAHYTNGIEEEIDDYTLSPDADTELKTTDENVAVSYTWAETERTVNIPITVNAGTNYTVSFDAGNGSYTGGDITETEYQGGITLPSATISVAGWTFAGWATASTSNTTTRPTLYSSGTTYYPTANGTLYAVYKLAGIDETKYKRVTTLSEATGASSMIFVDNTNSKVFKYNGEDITYATAPTETDGLITPSDDIVWALEGNNTDGYKVKTTSLETNRYAGFTTPSSTYANIYTYPSNTLTNGLWKFIQNTSGDNLFTLRSNTEKTSQVGSLRFYASSTNKWQVYYLSSSGFSVNSNVALKLYVPVQTAYNSNPSAIITPTVEFAKGGTTLYLDGTNTYTNTATSDPAKTISYTSSDEDVATVTSAGVVTAVGIGTATITASVAAELGVSNAAQDTYEVTVKSTTTISGIKAVNSTTTATVFTADLTDANITYVSGTHAYIQDASAAIYVSCADESWVAGKKFSGAVSGKVKKSYGVWEITEFTGTPVEGGSVPAALTDVEITDITSETYASYEGKKITLSGITVTTAMASSATSGGEVSDGTNTIKIGAPATGITLVKDEKGSVTGFVAQYNTTYRLNLYEQSQFVKTHNAPTAQTLTFTDDAVELDEDTDDYSNFTPQTVSGAQGTVTYAIEGDAIYENFDTSDGTFTLKTGTYGTATITATAAAANVTEAGVTTPYTETEKSYTVTTYPRYTSTFSVNGVSTDVRQATHGSEIAVPEPSDVGDYYFMGWKASSGIDTPTDEAPEMVTPPTTPTSNVTYYAVYAQERAGGEEEVTSTLNLKQSEPANSTSTVNGVTWSWNKLTFATSGNNVGMKGGDNATVTIDMPENTVKATQLSLVRSQSWGDATVVLSNSDGTIGSIGQTGNTYINFSSSNNTSSQYSLSQSTSKNAWISSFTLTFTVIGTENYDYRTSLPVVAVTVTASGYLSYCSPYKLDFSDTEVKAYKAAVDGEGTVTLTKVDVVPANVGVVLFSSEAKSAAEATEYTIPVTTADASDVTGNQMVGVLERTQVLWNPSAGVYNYILQSGNFKKATAGYLKPNRAYLSTNYNVEGAGAKPLTIIFVEEETTGISEKLRVKSEEYNAYNLSGQKVGDDYKGIIIVNGKKYVRK